MHLQPDVKNVNTVQEDRQHTAAVSEQPVKLESVLPSDEPGLLPDELNDNQAVGETSEDSIQIVHPLHRPVVGQILPPAIYSDISPYYVIS